MISSVVCPLVRCLLGRLMMSRLPVFRDAELLAPRHENVVLHREIGRVRLLPAG